MAKMAKNLMNQQKKYGSDMVISKFCVSLQSVLIVKKRVIS